MGKLSMFLRYNSRHHFYWCLGSGRDNRKMGWPRLNPISSVYGAGLRVVSLHEPLWLFRLRQRLFAYAGGQRCRRRDEQPDFDGRSDMAQPDTWDMGPDGNRTCSYCGSIHPDDLMGICRKVIADERYAIEGTTKSYKVYVKQPGVRNASEGAIEFYMHHAPTEPSPEDQRLFAEAVRISNERFRQRWELRSEVA